MDDVLRTAHELAADYLRGLRDRPVGAREDAGAIAQVLRGGGLPESGEDASAVVRALAEAVEPGLIASAGPRYYGFVFGGALPASIGADWLTSAWDQNAVLHAGSPAGAAAEQVAGEWMLDLLGLPADASFGLPTGAGLGNAVGVAAGRHAVLERAGWDVERRGLFGAPQIEVVIGDEGHASLLTALQYLGLGRERVTRVPTDEQGRMQSESLRRMLPTDGRPTIVCAQAGNVNTGAFDPLDEIADAVDGLANGWLHVDGAFGLWAHASPRFAHLVRGVERCDSWATDAHKWLNVNYDCGFVAVADPASHHAAMSGSGAYLQRTEAQREGWDWVLDSSRRARGFALYATLRSLGRQGVRELVERCCDLAARMAEQLAAEPGVEVLNEVVLNQVLVRFTPADGGDADEFTREVIRRVQADGTAWMGGTVWHGVAAMRISVSNWMTTEADADATVEAILRVTKA
jgi:glutamate/tyrosine decarboxylase-like PLP-dependent enzyme